MKSNTLFLGIVSCSGSQANAPGDSTIVTKKLTLAVYSRKRIKKSFELVVIYEFCGQSGHKKGTVQDLGAQQMQRQHSEMMNAQ